MTEIFVLCKCVCTPFVLELPPLLPPAVLVLLVVLVKLAPLPTLTFFRLGQVIMVCISDGRANVPLSVSNGEPVSV